MNEDNILEQARAQFKQQLKTDTGRVLVGLGLMVVLFTPWTQANAIQELLANLRIVSYIAGFSVATALITHITRRLLFPYFDMKALLLKAEKEPIASAIVILGMCIILATTIFASAGFFK